MNGYAYLDKYGIMHATYYREDDPTRTEARKASAKETARKYAKYNGKIVETNLADGGGYTDENGSSVMIYAKEKEFYYGSKSAMENKISEDQFKAKFPLSYALYQKLI